MRLFFFFCIFENTIPNNSYSVIWFKITLFVYEIAMPNTLLVYQWLLLHFKIIYWQNVFFCLTNETQTFVFIFCFIHLTSTGVSVVLSEVLQIPPTSFALMLFVRYCKLL